MSATVLSLDEMRGYWHAAHVADWLGCVTQRCRVCSISGGSWADPDST